MRIWIYTIFTSSCSHHTMILHCPLGNSEKVDCWQPDSWLKWSRGSFRCIKSPTFYCFITVIGNPKNIHKYLFGPAAVLWFFFSISPLSARGRGRAGLHWVQTQLRAIFIYNLHRTLGFSPPGLIVFTPSGALSVGFVCDNVCTEMKDVFPSSSTFS